MVAPRVAEQRSPLGAVPESDSFMREFPPSIRTTGAATFIGNTGTNFVADIAFQPAPEPASLVLSGIGLAALLARRFRWSVKR